jgi:hypothetical protein
MAMEQITTIKTKSWEILVFKAEAGSTFEVKRKESMPLHLMITKPNGQSSPRNIPEGDWQVLGTISHDRKYSFDPEPFVAHFGIGKSIVVQYMDYKNEFHYPFKDPKDSFISLTESTNKILWSNPMERPKFDGRYDIISERYGEMDALREYEQEVKKWQSLQDILIKEDEIAAVLLNQ